MSDARPPFKLGDRVAWSSQAAGYKRNKRGVIVEVVPRGEPPREHRPKGCGLMGRRDESYVVRVGRSRLMWPRTQHLRLDEEP